MNTLEEIVDKSTALAQNPINELADTATPKLKEFGEASDSVAQNRTSKLEEFRRAGSDSLAQNRLLFDWLSDDLKRKDLYDELRKEGFPILQFKSLLRSRNRGEWSMEDAYLISHQDQVEAALKHYSVEPYSKLGSGGRFMLGLDKREAHDPQRAVAARAMYYKPAEIEACAAAAFRRAAIRPLQDHVFDLSDLAEQAALNFV